MRSAPPSINIARLTYLLVCQAAGLTIAMSTDGSQYEISPTMGMVVGLGVAAFFILIESLMRGFSLRGFSTATFGLGVGLFCAWLLTRVQISDLVALAFDDRIVANPEVGDFVSALKMSLDVALFASLGFLGAALALRGNRDDFAFIIPYVRFRRDATGGVPCVVDAGAVMDGRIMAIMRTGFLDGRLVMPSFVLDELQSLVDGKEGPAREAAQRGLDCLAQLRADSKIDVSVHDAQGVARGENSHARLIELARLLNARLLTTDDNLAKLAGLQNQRVLNLNELDHALRPEVVVGQRIRVPLVRSGKDDDQAVGYLADGTMIVVNHAASRIGETVDAVVTSTLETPSGTMVFGELLKSKG
ncbi:MAG: hypothetical protein R3242_06260 [Akkermansiaceae bacterium]|nr:hypothetical protein [Akkermansiaceae bacterium]